MNEWAFTRACIKICGLIMLVFGLVGFAANSITGATMYFQARGLIANSSRSADDVGEKAALLSVAAYQKAWIAAGIRLAGNVIQMLVGLYLCRKYQRLLKWLVKDEPAMPTHELNRTG